MSTRFRRLTDLFVKGREAALPDGTHLWVQALNSYERDECMSDAQVARARLVMALKNHGDERAKIEARLLERGREEMEANVVSATVDDKYPEIINALEDDPDWTERLDIVKRTNLAESAKPADPAETQLVDTILKEWTEAISAAVDSEREWQTSHYSRVSDEELVDAYMDLWLERRASEVASAEYSLTELWYAVRYCEATKTDDGFDHTACNGHPDRVFETRTDVRSMPDDLHTILLAAVNDLNMAGRDPKDSAKATSSSASSPAPSAPGGSTPSTSTETHELPPGTSPQPSATP